MILTELDVEFIDTNWRCNVITKHTKSHIIYTDCLQVDPKQAGNSRI